MNLDNKLRELRDSKKMTQKELGDLVKVNQRTVSKWERGSATPGPAQMQFLQDFFDVDKEEIFFEAFNYKTKLKITI